MTRSLLFYSVRMSTVLKFLGYSILLVGLSNLFPLVISLFFQEWSATLSYFLVALVSFGLGIVMIQIKATPTIRFNEAVVIVCFSYLYVALSASVPISMVALPWGDAFFEAVSAITTTGLTAITDWDTIPETTFFARAWLQWMGGLGIVLFSIALLLNQGSITKELCALQSEPDDVLGGSKVYAKTVISTYCFFTGVGILAMLLTGSSLFQSVLYVFSSVSTGGFAPQQESFYHLSSYQILILTMLMTLCSLSIPYYRRILEADFRVNLQIIQIVGFIALVSILAFALGASFDSWILAFSSQTTTGFSPTDLSTLGSGEKFLLIISMLIGGGVGSTAGGFKILRLFLLIVFLRTLIIRQTQTKHAYYKPIFLQSSIEDDQIQYALGLITTYLFVVALSWLCFLFGGYEPIDSLFIVASALGTVGLSAGLGGAELPLFLKGVLCVDMLFGRLEIIPWLIFLYPRTFFGERLEE